MTMPELVKTAWSVGQGIELPGIGYGRIHWGNKTDLYEEPVPYYHFLAGLVRCFGFNRILEIGTHWGGATRAMWHGLVEPQGAKVVTVDVTTESDNRLQQYPGIQKIVGDGNTEAVFTQIAERFAWEPVDLVYIDAIHQTVPTMMSYALYGVGLRSKLVVFDDISYNQPMMKAWQLIQATLPPGDSVNAAEIERAIRAKPGFGVALIRANL